jgi:putative membrane protein
MEGGGEPMIGWHGGYGYGSHMLGYGFGLGWIFTIIVWVLIIWAIVAFVRGGQCWDGRCDYKDKGDDSALRILKERYAKGEIDKLEFEQKKKDIENMK